MSVLGLPLGQIALQEITKHQKAPASACGHQHKVERPRDRRDEGIDLAPACINANKKSGLANRDRSLNCYNDQRNRAAAVDVDFRFRVIIRSGSRNG